MHWREARWLATLVFVGSLALHSRLGLECRDKIENPYPEYDSKLSSPLRKYQEYVRRQGHRAKNKGKLDYGNDHYPSPWRLSPYAFESGVCTNLTLQDSPMNGIDCFFECTMNIFCDVYHKEGNFNVAGTCWIGEWRKAVCRNPTSMYVCSFGTNAIVDAILWVLGIAISIVSLIMVYTLCVCVRFHFPTSMHILLAAYAHIRTTLVSIGTALQKRGLRWNGFSCYVLGQPAQDARVKFASSTVTLWLLFGGLRMASYAVRLYFDVLTGDPDRKVRFLLNSDVFFTLCWTTLGLVGKLWPSHISPGFLDLLQILASSIFAWQYFTMQYRDYMVNSMWMSSSRLLLAIFCGNAHLSIILNLLLTCIDLWCLEHAPDLGGGSSEAIRTNSIFHLFASSFVIFALESSQRGHVEALQRARDTDSSLRMVWRLLEAMCDAVVKLDSKHCIAETCPKLDSILMRSHPLDIGLKFEELLVESSRQRFVDFLECERHVAIRLQSEPRERVVLAKLLHAEFNTPYGSVMPLDMFASCIERMDGEYVYLLGIVGKQEGGLDTFDSSSHPAQADTSSSGSRGRYVNLHGVEMSAWLDAFSRDLTILRCSSKFAIFQGSSSMISSFADWCDPQLTEFIQDRINAIYHGEEIAGDVHIGQIILAPPRLRVVGIYLQGDCTLSFPDIDTVNTEQLEIEIRMKKLKQRRHQVLSHPVTNLEVETVKEILKAQTLGHARESTGTRL